MRACLDFTENEIEKNNNFSLQNRTEKKRKKGENKNDRLQRFLSAPQNFEGFNDSQQRRGMLTLIVSKGGQKGS